MERLPQRDTSPRPLIPRFGGPSREDCGAPASTGRPPPHGFGMQRPGSGTVQDQDMKEWLDATGYHDAENRSRILKMHREMAKLDSDELEIQRRRQELKREIDHQGAYIKLEPTLTRVNFEDITPSNQPKPDAKKSTRNGPAKTGSKWNRGEQVVTPRRERGRLAASSTLRTAPRQPVNPSTGASAKQHAVPLQQVRERGRNTAIKRTRSVRLLEALLFSCSPISF